MSQGRTDSAHASPDRQGEARAVAYLMLAAAPFVVATIVLKDRVPPAEAVAVYVTGAVLALAGLVCLRAPQRIPDRFWRVVPFVATPVIAGLNVATSDASTGSQLFFLWPTLYAAMYLSRPILYAVLVAVMAGEAATVFATIDDLGLAWTDLTGMAMALSMSSIVVMTLRERAARLMRVLADQALADPLTGLPNRRCFDIEMANADSWQRRNDGSLALLSVDLDRFKDINDTWGHATGDLALQAVADALREVSHETDVVARLGGDEFVMLIRGDREQAHRAAEALRRAASADTTLPGGPPGLSIGLAVLPDDADTLADLVVASDNALYRAKVAGRGRVVAATDRAATDRAATDRAATDRAATDRAATDRAATDRAATDRAATDRAATDRAATDRAATDRAATDRAATDRAATDRVSASGIG